MLLRLVRQERRAGRAPAVLNRFAVGAGEARRYFSLTSFLCVSDTVPIAAVPYQERAHLARVRAKTLLVAGTRDQFFDVPALEETAAAIPSAELVRFANETHMLPVERHRDVARVIGRFLSA